MWVPLERVDGSIHVIMDDPHNILKRDTIENILKTKAVKYDVALPEDIIKFINLFYSTNEEDQSISDILGRLVSDEEVEEDEGEVISESDSVIMQIVIRSLTTHMQGAHLTFTSNQILRRKTWKSVTELTGNACFIRPFRTITGPLSFHE
jgi:hypothetical protein